MAGRSGKQHSQRPTGRDRLVINASYVAAVHTCLALAAFGSALLLGCALHFKKIVRNGIAGYPDEWFPSVSATIGDWYPERNLFQILIAITSGPRFSIVFLQYLLNRQSQSSLPGWVFLCGVIRTLSCGGWVYITSNDDHDVHDVLMILYILCNVPWMLGGIYCTPTGHMESRKRRKLIATLFFVSVIPMIYFFVQHKVYRIPGAYTWYSFFEWGLILLDILYDSITGIDFERSQLQIMLGRSLDANYSGDSIPTPSTSKNSESASTVDRNTETQHPTPSKTYANDASVKLESGSLILKKLLATSQLRSILSFTADVYFSYLFWSIVTSLLTTLFYFSIWELGFSGSEAALFVYLSPVLLGIPSLRQWATTMEGRVTLRLLSLIGLAAYKLDDPVTRLFVVGGANLFSLVSHCADWMVCPDAYQGLLLGLGLILSSLSKHANHSNNPVWPMLNEETGGYNKMGIALALLALLELGTRPPAPHHTSTTSQKGVGTSSCHGRDTASHWLASSIALGSLFFTLHCLLSDSSTIIAWSWTGYESRKPRGPLPHLYGAVTILAQSLGLLIPVVLPSSMASALLTHIAWFAYGCVSSFIMYNFRNWLGFAGGLNLAVFCMSITPSVISQAAANGFNKPGRTLFLAFLLVIIFYVANVFTAAYAFVPGGVYFRERTDLVLVAQLATMSLAFRWPKTRFGRLGPTLRSSRATAVYTVAFLVVLSLSSVLVTIFHWPVIGPTPYKPGTGVLNAGIWTVHFGFDNAGRDSQRRIRDIIRDLQLDVVGLLETDLHRTVYGNRDLTRVITEELGYYVDLGPGPNMHTWGVALLSKFPIISSDHHLLPSPHGELAPAIEATLDVHGTEVTVVISHNGQEEDALDRELQSKELARIMAKSYPQPVIFLGYVVTKPHAPRPAPYDFLVNDGLMYDIDPHDRDRWCEYILYRGLYRTAYARVSRGIVTDTELQIGQFVVPKHGFNLINQTEESRLLRAWKEQLPEHHWLPMEYYGSERQGGVNGHYYHVFDTPLYYRLPDDAHV
ncbi:Frag1/DRAM/Sfk1 family-domain-containing protein [Pisolithus croceorrhizus]|nr:Frag1/DRAM/Sfk1 family-domain-containing protein [Pisolithus croceorrhizus]